MRVTQKVLEELAGDINEALDAPGMRYTDRSDGTTQINVGHHFVAAGCGGYLFCKVAEDGTIASVLPYGVSPARELHGAMIGYLRGIVAGKGARA